MIDPKALDVDALSAFDAAGIGVAIVDIDFDIDEPLVIEATTITASATETLGNVPVAFDGCVLLDCDLSLMQICGLKNSRIEGAKLRGTHFNKYVRNVVFDRCQLAECLFRMIRLERVVFERSKLEACDFYGAELEKLTFPASEFHGVGFDACELTDIDLTEAALLMIGDPRTLRGAAICETQVPLIATRLAELSGIDVHDC